MPSIDVYVDALLTGNSTPLTRPTTTLAAQQGVVVKKLSNAFNNDGCIVRRVFAIWNKGTENDGTIYRVFRQLPGNLIPLSIIYAGSAIAGLTSVSCGLYKTGQVIPGGSIGAAATAGVTAVVSGFTPANGAACFANSVSLAAGFANFRPSVGQDLMTAINTTFSQNPIVLGATLQTRLFEYAGDSVANRQGRYDLALTLNTGGVNPGAMGVMMEYVIG